MAPYPSRSLWRRARSRASLPNRPSSPPCAGEIPGDGGRPRVSEPEVDVVRNPCDVETPAQDLEWRDAYAASQKDCRSQPWIYAEAPAERRRYLYGRCEVQERGTADPAPRRGGSPFSRRSRRKRRGGRGTGLGAGKPADLAITNCPVLRAITPAVSERGVGAEVPYALRR